MSKIHGGDYEYISKTIKEKKTDVKGRSRCAENLMNGNGKRYFIHIKQQKYLGYTRGRKVYKKDAIC